MDLIKLITDQIKKDILDEGYSASGRYVAEPTFKTGDHVHLASSFRHSFGTDVNIKKYGVVHSHSTQAAKVKFEDGSEGTYNHTGKERGDKDGRYSTLSPTLQHSEVYSSGKTVRVTNDEHKAHIVKQVAEHRAAIDHRDNVDSLKKRINDMHHTTFKPEHVAKLNSMLNDIDSERKSTSGE